MRRPNPETLARMCDRFNTAYPVGTPVQYFSVLPRGGEPGTPPVRATVREPAFVLSGHSPMVFLDGVRGCVHINHVFPAPAEAAR